MSLGQVGFQVLFSLTHLYCKNYRRNTRGNLNKYAFLSMTNNLSNTTRFYTTINVLIQLDLKSKVH